MLVATNLKQPVSLCSWDTVLQRPEHFEGRAWVADVGSNRVGFGMWMRWKDNWKEWKVNTGCIIGSKSIQKGIKTVDNE